MRLKVAQVATKELRLLPPLRDTPSKMERVNNLNQETIFQAELNMEREDSRNVAEKQRRSRPESVIVKPQNQER